jgi:hypothetical protein
MRNFISNEGFSHLVEVRKLYFFLNFNSIYLIILDSTFKISGIFENKQ